MVFELFKLSPIRVTRQETPFLNVWDILISNFLRGFILKVLQRLSETTAQRSRLLFLFALIWRHNIGRTISDAFKTVVLIALVYETENFNVRFIHVKKSSRLRNGIIFLARPKFCVVDRVLAVSQDFL